MKKPKTRIGVLARVIGLRCMALLGSPNLSTLWETPLGRSILRNPSTLLDGLGATFLVRIPFLLDPRTMRKGSSSVLPPSLLSTLSTSWSLGIHLGRVVIYPPVSPTQWLATPMVGMAWSLGGKVSVRCPLLQWVLYTTGKKVFEGLPP